MTTRRDQWTDRRVPAGFTLIELIVVLSIIAILTSIGLMAAHHVRQNSQISLTKDMIKALDTAYNGIVQNKGSSGTSPIWRDESGNEFAVVDGALVVPTAATRVEPSLGLLVLACGQDPALKDTILRADGKYVENKPLVSAQANFPAGPQANQVTVPVLKDPWGNAIRFVHPRFAGGYGAYPQDPARENLKFDGRRQAGGSWHGEFSRSFQPAAGVAGWADEGLCRGSIGYFYSAGVDSDPGTRDNNVYANVPPFPVETAKYSPSPAGS